MNETQERLDAPPVAEEGESAASIAQGDKPSTPPGAPSETQRTLMFTALVLVLASAPAWVSTRALRAGRSADFPLGDSLGEIAIVLFALVAIGVLAACFWRGMSLATWQAKSIGAMLGASGVVMACIGATHALAGIISGSLGGPTWFAWLVLLAVYPIAGQVATYFAGDFVGVAKTPAKRKLAPAGGVDPALDPAVNDEYGLADTPASSDKSAAGATAGLTRERNFARLNREADTPQSELEFARAAASDDDIDAVAAPDLDFRDFAGNDTVESDPETREQEPSRSQDDTSRAAPRPAPAAYEHDPFADPDEDPQWDSQGSHDDEYDDEYDDDDYEDDDYDDYDDDPFANADD